MNQWTALLQVGLKAMHLCLFVTPSQIHYIFSYLYKLIVTELGEFGDNTKIKIIFTGGFSILWTTLVSSFKLSWMTWVDENILLWFAFTSSWQKRKRKPLQCELADKKRNAHYRRFRWLTETARLWILRHTCSTAGLLSFVSEQESLVETCLICSFPKALLLGRRELKRMN